VGGFNFSKVKDLPEEVQRQLFDPRIAEIDKDIKNKFGLSVEQNKKFDAIFWDVIYRDMELGQMRKEFQAQLGLDEKTAFQMMIEVGQQILMPMGEYFSNLPDYLGWMKESVEKIERKEKMVAEEAAEEAEEEVAEPEIPMSPSFEASARDFLKQYRDLSDLKLTQTAIYSQAQEREVSPTLENWVKDYLYETNSGEHSSFERSEYLFKNANVKNLAAEEKEKVAKILRSYDQKIPLKLARRGDYLEILETDAGASSVTPPQSAASTPVIQSTPQEVSAPTVTPLPPTPPKVIPVFETPVSKPTPQVVPEPVPVPEPIVVPKIISVPAPESIPVPIPEPIPVPEAPAPVVPTPAPPPIVIPAPPPPPAPVPAPKPIPVPENIPTSPIPPIISAPEPLIVNFNQREKDLIAGLSPNFDNEIVTKRVKDALASLIRGSRSRWKVLEVLSKNESLGGAGLDNDHAQSLVRALEAELRAESAPAVAKKIEPLEIEPTDELQLIDKFFAAGAGLSSTPNNSVIPAPPSPSFTPAPSPSATNKITDIIHPRKIVSPIEELRLISVDDLRNFSGGFKAALVRVKEKIFLAGENSPQNKIQAMRAWKDSAVNRLYLQLGQECLMNGKNIAVVLSERAAGAASVAASSPAAPTLSLEEFQMLADFNQELRN